MISCIVSGGTEVSPLAKAEWYSEAIAERLSSLSRCIYLLEMDGCRKEQMMLPRPNAICKFCLHATIGTQS